MRTSSLSLLVLLIAVVVTGCSIFGGGKPEPTHFEENRTYVHWLASSQEECDALNDQGINCFQMAEFFTDGIAEIMMSDIVHRGTYSIVDGERIVVSIDNNPEIPGEITFVIVDEGQQLRLESNDSIWERE